MKKPGRNDLCSCGSGQKYKKCCEVKKGTPKKINAQILLSGDAISDKMQNISQLFKRPAPPASPAITPSSSETSSQGTDH